MCSNWHQLASTMKTWPGQVDENHVMCTCICNLGSWKNENQTNICAGKYAKKKPKVQLSCTNYISEINNFSC